MERSTPLLPNRSGQSATPRARRNALAGVPVQAALRAAFDATMMDEAFLLDAQRSRLLIDPMTAGEMEALFRRAYASPGAVIARAKELLKRAGR